MQSYNYFAQSTPYAIAPHCISQRLFDAPAEPAQIEVIRTKEYSELAAGSPRFAIDRVVFGAAHQTAGARKAEPQRSIRLA